MKGQHVAKIRWHRAVEYGVWEAGKWPRCVRIHPPDEYDRDYHEVEAHFGGGVAWFLEETFDTLREAKLAPEVQAMADAIGKAEHWLDIERIYSEVERYWAVRIDCCTVPGKARRAA